MLARHVLIFPLAGGSTAVQDPQLAVRHSLRRRPTAAVVAGAGGPGLSRTTELQRFIALPVTSKDFRAFGQRRRNNG